jgi:hypothetical protein
VVTLRRVARLLGADVTEVSVKERAYPAVSVDSRVRKWPSVAAVRADSATDEALRATTDDWSAVPVDQRVQILRALRAFRDRCPLCAGALEQTSEPVESCCVSGEVVALTCRDCNRPLLERSPDADAWLSLADV